MDNEEKLYKNLLEAHYLEDVSCAKSSYNFKTYKEIYQELEFREKTCLDLQFNIILIEEDKKRYLLLDFFKEHKRPKMSLNSFVSSLLNIETTEPINAKSHKRYLDIIKYLKDKKLWIERS